MYFLLKSTSFKNFQSSREEKYPDWMLTDDEIVEKENNMIEMKKIVDEVKLAKLITRRKIYGDICQVASEAQLRYLLIVHNNNVPSLIRDLEDWVNVKGTQTHIPPAFYDRDGKLVQPPNVEIPLF